MQFNHVILAAVALLATEVASSPMGGMKDKFGGMKPSKDGKPTSSCEASTITETFTETKGRTETETKFKTVTVCVTQTVSGANVTVTAPCKPTKKCKGC